MNIYTIDQLLILQFSGQEVYNFIIKYRRFSTLNGIVKTLKYLI